VVRWCGGAPFGVEFPFFSPPIAYLSNKSAIFADAMTKENIKEFNQLGNKRKN
jgi:hypothetical protein